MRNTTLLILALLSMVGQCLASDLTINLDAPVITTSPGDTVVFTAVLANNDTSILDLNSISVSLNGMFSTDITPFFTGPATLDASTSTMTSQTVDFGLVAVTVLLPYTDPFGPHTGTIDILGGVEGTGGYDPTTQNLLGSANFTVNVQAPEPATGGLLLAAIAALYFRRPRKHTLVRLRKET